MKLLFTNDWLRRKISTDPDGEPAAGGPAQGKTRLENAAPTGERQGVQLRVALGVLVRQLRLRAGLTIAQLADQASVPEDELRQVEHDPHYTARPRLIFRLSEFFDVPLTKLSQLSGSTRAVDRVLYNDAVRFAAHADDLSTLTEEERQALDAFVALLHGRTED